MLPAFEMGAVLSGGVVEVEERRVRLFQPRVA